MPVAMLGGTGLLLVLALAAALGLAAGARGNALGGPIYLASALVCGAMALVAVAMLVGGVAGGGLGPALAPGQGPAVVLPVGLPWLLVHFRLDALSLWFVLVVNLAGAAAAVYGRGYAAHLDEPDRVIVFFPLFLGAMNLVLLADDAFVFLFAWEVMSLSSWLLVLANHRQPGNAAAALIYLVMALMGTAALLLAFGILAGFEGAYGFAAMRAAPVTGWLGDLAILLVLVGAGSKAGLVPLHAWLPQAHPAAPSHVSALMSGAMTKVALYGLIRVLFDLSGGAGWGWGAVLMAVGSLSAVLGILYAMMQNDLKTLLAYSTVENVGIIAIGLGLAVVFRADGLHTLATLALVAALFHVLNHGVMKSLLFFVAGAVQTATGERDLDRLGGLMRRLPATATLALVGAAAISALPPFNGFASEWLTFQAILSSPSLPQWSLKFGVPVVGALLALSAALAGACFVRAYGIGFLGRPRSPQAAAAGEVDRWMLGAMAALALFCLFLGLFPAVATGPLQQVAVTLLGGPAPAPGARPFADLLWLSPLGVGRSSYSGVLIFLVVLVVTFATIYGVHRLTGARVRKVPAWDCGFPEPALDTQYSASSFAQPVRRMFGTLVFRAREEVDMPPPGDARPARFILHLIDPVWALVYAPVLAALEWTSGRLNVLQYLTIRRYLAMVFGALVLLLSVVVLLK